MDRLSYYDNESGVWELFVALLISAIIAILGGSLSGLAMIQYGGYGAVALWGTGALGGYLSSMLLPRNQPTACLLALSVVVAMLIAEVSWIRWTSSGASWTLAMSQLRLFFDFYEDLSVIAMVFTLGGVVAAYRQSS